MSPRSKHEYLRAIALRYQRAPRVQKTRILDEYCATCGYHRKYAIIQLNAFRQRHRPAPPRRKPGRPSRYAVPELLQPLQHIWQTAHLPCSKRLKALLPLWLPAYQRSVHALPHEVLAALQTISPATIDRLLRPIRPLYRGVGRTTTKPGRLLRHQIPIRTNQWDETVPGFLEADTVAHCGDSTAGEYALTIDATDLATGWTEQRAVWGKGETAVVQQLTDIEAALPFLLRGVDVDNGSEFLNWHLVRHFQERPTPVAFTRARAYQKNDNAHIEQKNWTHVRQWLGYRRFDDPILVDRLNDLYTTEWRLFHNFFLPSVKLLDKQRLGATIKKVHDAPQTPYQRVLAAPQVPAKTQVRLKTQFGQLDPFQLRAAMDRKIRAIHQLVGPGKAHSEATIPAPGKVLF